MYARQNSEVQYAMDSWKNAMTETEMSDMCEPLERPAPQSREQRGTVLQEALKVVNGARQDAYGNPEDNFKVVGELMDIVRRHGKQNGDSLTACFNLMCLKFGRILSNPHDRDSWRDMAGYVALGCDMAFAKDIVKE